METGALGAAIAVYTRRAESGYSAYLGNSVHIAVSLDGETYEPLFRNYGILFAKGGFDAENRIVSRGCVKPIVFRLDNGFGISALETIRSTDENGGLVSEERTGRALLWRTADFISFSDAENIGTNEYERLGEGCSVVTGIDGALDAGCVSVTRGLCGLVMAAWAPVRCVGADVPPYIEASSAKELAAVRAAVRYSDGSVHEKAVDWELSGVDFSASGEYRIMGTIRRPAFPFPVGSPGKGDPIIAYYGGSCYFIATDDSTNKKFVVYKADTIEGLFEPNARRSVILEYTEGKWEDTFWAPEFHIAGGDMCLFCTLSPAGSGFNPQSYVMRLKRGGDIMTSGDWEEPRRVLKRNGEPLCVNPLGDGRDGITLDMTYFEIGGKGYAAWSYRMLEGCDSGSMILFAAVDSRKPWRLTSDPIILTRPVYGWENIDRTDNNEGPFAIVTDKKVYMTYSGGHAYADSYAVGMLSADIGADLLDPASWTKLPRPALASGFVEGEYGPGHNGFFTDENKDTYITYHAHAVRGESARLDGIRRVHFGAGGKPVIDMSAERDLKEEYRRVSAILISKPPLP